MALDSKDMISSLHQLDDIADRQNKQNIALGVSVDKAVKNYNSNVDEMENTKKSYNNAVALRSLLRDGSDAINKSQTALSNTMQKMEDHHMVVSNLVRRTRLQMDKAADQANNFQKDVTDVLFDSKRRMSKIIAEDTKFYIESMPSFKIFNAVSKGVEKFNIPVNRGTGALSNIFFATIGYYTGKNV